MSITIRKEMELDDLRWESSAVTELVQTFMDDDDAVEEALRNYLEDCDEDDIDSEVGRTFVYIVRDIQEELGRALKRSEVDQLVESGYCTEAELRAAEVAIADPEPELDEEGRAYELVEEDPRQQTLFDETGLPPVKVKRYIDGDGGNENH